MPSALNGRATKVSIGAGAAVLTMKLDVVEETVDLIASGSTPILIWTGSERTTGAIDSTFSNASEANTVICFSTLLSPKSIGLWIVADRSNSTLDCVTTNVLGAGEWTPTLTWDLSETILFSTFSSSIAGCTKISLTTSLTISAFWVILTVLVTCLSVSIVLIEVEEIVWIPTIKS